MSQPNRPTIPETPNVTAMTTSASTAIAIGQSFNPVFFTMIAEASGWIKFGASDVAAPDETDTSGTGRCYRFVKDVEFTKELNSAQTHFRIKGEGAANVRWYVEE